jgi:hypothetical protein
MDKEKRTDMAFRLLEAMILSNNYEFDDTDFWIDEAFSIIDKVIEKILGGEEKNNNPYNQSHLMLFYKHFVEFEQKFEALTIMGGKLLFEGKSKSVLDCFIEKIGHCIYELKDTLDVEMREEVLQGYVYLIKADIPKYAYKIGVSTQPEKRAESFYTVKMPFETKLIHSIPCDDMLSFEEALHRRYDNKRGTGEWFNLSDAEVVDICSIKKVITRIETGWFGELKTRMEIKE